MEILKMKTKKIIESLEIYQIYTYDNKTFYVELWKTITYGYKSIEAAREALKYQII